MPVKMRKKKVSKKGSRSLVLRRLEYVSKILFRRHFKLITDLVGNSPGIYALYDGGELYYVGKSTDLKKRVKQHLRDRHYASWTHFSLYLVRKSAHINEIETMLIRIANPKGNRFIPKGKKDSEMLKELKAMVKEQQKIEFEDMFAKYESDKYDRKKKYPYIKKKSLKGLVSKSKKIYRSYKGKDYIATLTPGGSIKLKNRIYNTPTAAAKVIVDRRTVNGWNFWYIRDSSGEWVRLADFKG